MIVMSLAYLDKPESRVYICGISPDPGDGELSPDWTGDREMAEVMTEEDAAACILLYAELYGDELMWAEPV